MKKHEQKKRVWPVVTSTLLFVTLATTVASLFFISTEKESEATVTDLITAPSTKTKRFSEALGRLGHEKPRPYRLDGNVVYISVRHANKPPKELIAEYQNQFAASYINDKPVYQDGALEQLAKLQNTEGAQNVPPQKLTRAFEDTLQMVKGGLIPAEISDDYVRMVGGEPAIKVEDYKDAVKLAKLPPEKAFKAIRTVEFFKRPSGSTVVATFSDDNLDISRSLYQANRNEAPYPSAFQPNLPPCRSCAKIHQFEDLDPKGHFIGTIFESRERPQDIVSYYDSLYETRGWSLDSTSKTLRNHIITGKTAPLPSELNLHRVYQKPEGETVSLIVTPGPDGLSYVDLRYDVEQKYQH